MLGNGARIRAIEARQAVQAAAIVAIAGEVTRSRRRPDLSAPRTIELRPLSAYVGVAVREGLQKLFDKRHFDICLFRSLCDLARVYPPADLVRHLEPLHCRDWAELDPEYREQLQNHIIAAFVPLEAEAGEDA